MCLDVTVNVDVVDTVQLEKLVHGFPVVVPLNSQLEKAHIFRAKLTHLISSFIINAYMTL